MNRFINYIKEQDKKITSHFENNNYRDIQKVILDLEKEHEEVKYSLNEIASTLYSIEKHELESLEDVSLKKEEVRGSWLKKIIKEVSLFNDKKTLTTEEIKELEKYKAHLEFERKQIEEQHKHLHALIAKAKSHFIAISNEYIKELTKGYDIAQVGEKLLENFGKELKDIYNYNSGYKEILKFLEVTFDITKKDAKIVFDLLLKHKVISYELYNSNEYEFPVYNNVDEFVNINSYPLFGKWTINF